MKVTETAEGIEMTDKKKEKMRNSMYLSQLTAHLTMLSQLLDFHFVQPYVVVHFRIHYPKN